MIEKCIGVRKSRQLYRFLRHFKVTFLCLLLTLLVLRGTIGAGKFGTPEQDFLQLRNRFSSRKLYLPRNTTKNQDLLSSAALQQQFSVVVNYDERRRDWLRLQHSEFRNVVVGKMKPVVLLVTGSPSSSTPCKNPLGDYYLLKSIKNKIDYSRMHGIQIYYDVVLLKVDLSVIRALLLGNPEVEFIWWMDSGAVFTDMSFEVPWERYESYNLVLHGVKKIVYDDLSSRMVLNTGSFLIRNCQWSLDLIGKVLKDKSEFEANDWSAMVAMLAKEKEKWGSKLYLENEYYLDGFLEDMVGRFEEMREVYRLGFGEHRWPVVTHFVGCKLCSKGGDYPLERCLKQIERALNFGEDQILRMSSSRVRSVLNGTSTLQGVKNETGRVLSS